MVVCVGLASASLRTECAVLPDRNEQLVGRGERFVGGVDQLLLSQPRWRTR